MTMTNAKAKKVLAVQGWELQHKKPNGDFRAYSKRTNAFGAPLYRCAAPTLEALCLKVVGRHWEQVGEPA